MEKPIKRLPPVSLIPEQIQDAIKQFILDNQLKHGDKLPSENNLSQQLGVSRNSVREAVQSLATLGILEVRRGSGLYVKGFTLQPIIENISYDVFYNLSELEDMLQVREVLENGMVDIALPLITPERIQILDALAQEMCVAAERGEPLVKTDQAFHIELFKPVDNSILLQLQDVFWSVFRKAVLVVEMADFEPLHTAKLHVAVVDAIRTGDPDTLRHALSEHYSGLKERLRRSKELQQNLKRDAIS